MKIIEQERAPNPRRVKIFIAEKGLDIPFEKLELNKGEHKIFLRQTTRVAYYPFPLEGRRTRMMSIA